MIRKLRDIFGRKRTRPTLTYQDAFLRAYIETVIEEIPSGTLTSQKSIDTEHSAYFLPAEKLLIPPYELAPFLTLYETDPLSKALIDADVNLTVSPIECVSESDELCSYVENFNERIDLQTVLWELQRDIALFGFGAVEIVGNASSLISSTKILGLKRLDPRFLIVRKDQKGRFQTFLQRPGFGSQNLSSEYPAGMGLSYQNALDPETVLFVNSSSPRTTYGHPILQSVQARLTLRNKLITAAVSAARAHSNPIVFLSWVSDLPVDSPETDRELARLKAAVKKIDSGDSRWLFAAGGQGSEYTTATLGHSNIPDLTGLIDTLSAEIITSCGQTASSLGYTLRSKGASKEESNNKQTISNIENKQRRLVSALNSKLYKILPLIESETPAGTIIVRMEPPDLSSVKEAEETQTLKINNAILEARAGIVSAQQVATSLGHKSIADEKRFKDFISQEQGEENPNDPNDVQQKRAAILGKGKNPGNNPTGEK